VGLSSSLHVSGCPNTENADHNGASQRAGSRRAAKSSPATTRKRSIDLTFIPALLRPCPNIDRLLPNPIALPRAALRPFQPAPTANYLTSFFNTHTVPRNFGSRFRSLRRGESVEVFTLRSLRRAPNSASRHFKLAEPQSIPSVSVAEADMSRKVSSVQCCGLSLTFQSSPRAGGGLLGHHRLHPCPQRPHHHLRKAHSEGASSKD
jgi:hypothetical protein